MDVGLVCDQCSAFQPMGASTCDRCGAALSLDAGRPAAAPRTSAARADAAPAPGRVLAPRRSAPGSVTTGSGAGISALNLSRTCATCSGPVPVGNQFCGHCGAQLPEETQPAAQVPPMPASRRGAGRSANGARTLFFGAMQAARAKLVLIKGDGLDGVSFTLAGDEHVAGRGDVDLCFSEDPYMSPEHANFYYREGRLMMRDQSTANGVYLRIRGSRPVDFGDRFLVGEQVLEIQETLRDVALEPIEDGTYVYASPRGPSSFRLVQILRGGDSGLAFRPPGDVVSVGREGNDLNFPDDPFISGHHAQVSLEDGTMSLTDLGSKNGTFLKVPGETALEHGDYVFMGQQLLRVEIV